MKKGKKMTFGEKLKSLRKEQKLTLKDVAERSGLSIVSVNFYENDKQKPSLVNVQKLAKGLNCTFEELYEHYERIK